MTFPAKIHTFPSLNAATSTSHSVSAPALSLLMKPSVKLSGLLKASVATNVMASRSVQTEVARKFTGSTANGI